MNHASKLSQRETKIALDLTVGAQSSVEFIYSYLVTNKVSPPLTLEKLNALEKDLNKELDRHRREFSLTQVKEFQAFTFLDVVKVNFRLETLDKLILLQRGNLSLSVTLTLLKGISTLEHELYFTYRYGDCNTGYGEAIEECNKAALSLTSRYLAQ